MFFINDSIDYTQYMYVSRVCKKYSLHRSEIVKIGVSGQCEMSD